MLRSPAAERNRCPGPFVPQQCSWAERTARARSRDGQMAQRSPRRSRLGWTAAIVTGAAAIALGALALPAIAAAHAATSASARGAKATLAVSAISALDAGNLLV